MSGESTGRKSTAGESLRAYWWRPGQSANPGGRKPLAPEVREACQALSVSAVRRLAHLAGLAPDGTLRKASIPPSVQLRACEVLLDRAWGRPEVAVSVTATADAGDAPEVAALREAAAAALAALAGRAAPAPVLDTIARPDAPTAPGEATPARLAQADPPAPPNKP